MIAMTFLGVSVKCFDKVRRADIIITNNQQTALTTPKGRHLETLNELRYFLKLISLPNNFVQRFKSLKLRGVLLEIPIAIGLES